MTTRLLAVSIDLDEIPCYTAIHALPAPKPSQAHAVYERAVPRFERLLHELGVPATFFAIGQDLDNPAAAKALRRLHDAGHEIGNHSLSHHYDLTRRARAEMEREVHQGAARIAAATGRRPVGVRAPGYTMSDTLIEVLAEAGVAYDSSVFPCPAYYGAKLAALGLIRMKGRTSQSLASGPAVLAAPADPYHCGKPYTRRGAGLLELPIAVTRDLTGRLPYIGTGLTVAGPRITRTLTRCIEGRPLVNLELHGIDLLDARADGLSELAKHQRDLSVPLASKRAALLEAIEGLTRVGYEPVTLAQAAEHFS